MILLVVLGLIVALFAAFASVIRILGKGLIAVIAGSIAGVVAVLSDVEPVMAALLSGVIAIAAWRLASRSADAPASIQSPSHVNRQAAAATSVNISPRYARTAQAWGAAMQLASSRERAMLSQAQQSCDAFLVLADNLDMADVEGRDLLIRIEKHIPSAVDEAEEVCRIQPSQASQDAAASLVRILAGIGRDAQAYLNARQRLGNEALELRENHLNQQRKR